MKTNYLFSLKYFNYFILILVGISVISCGSFKNSSYEDNDGIYSSTSKRETELNREEQSVNANSNIEYAQKFKDLQRNFEESVYFTDVNNYVSENDTVVTVARNYADWGSNTTELSINYHNYGWNNWGWNGWYNPMWNNWGWNNWYGYGWNNWYGYGWNNWDYNPWFSGYYGYGWNNWYGNGWNNWGWNNWYGYNVAYNNGRRGMNGNFGNGSGRYVTVEGRNSQIGNSNTRTNTRIAPTTRNSDTRISTPNTRTTTTTPTRVSTSPTRTTSPSTSPTRTSTPSRIDTGGGRSSGSFGGGSSSGGGRSGGSSGGGRGGRG